MMLYTLSVARAVACESSFRLVKSTIKIRSGRSSSLPKNETEDFNENVFETSRGHRMRQG